MSLDEERKALREERNLQREVQLYDQLNAGHKTRHGYAHHSFWGGAHPVRRTHVPALAAPHLRFQLLKLLGSDKALKQQVIALLDPFLARVEADQEAARWEGRVLSELIQRGPVDLHVLPDAYTRYWEIEEVFNRDIAPYFGFDPKPLPEITHADRLHWFGDDCGDVYCPICCPRYPLGEPMTERLEATLDDTEGAAPKPLKQLEGGDGAHR